LGARLFISKVKFGEANLSTNISAKCYNKDKMRGGDWSTLKQQANSINQVEVVHYGNFE